MKKTYIAPKAKEYTVNVKCENLVQASPVSLTVEDGETDIFTTKEESDNVVSIWDLY